MSKQIPLSCFLVVILAVGCAKRQQPKSVPAPVAPVSLGTPTIPAKSQWKSNMVTLGQKWATWLDNPKNTPLAFGVESEVWYYDGGRAFQQIASYTRDPKWNKYADQILSAYADYVITNNGGIPGYRVFSRGLLMGFQRTGNAKYQQALNALVYGSRSVTAAGVELRYYRQHGTATKAGGAALNPQWNPQFIRESAYITDAMVANEVLTGKRHPLLLVGVYDCVIPDLNAFMDPTNKYDPVNNPRGTYLGSGPPPFNFINNFMIGLSLETLIEYYEMTVSEGEPDPKIPPIIRQVLDFFWQNCVEQSTGAMYYNSNITNGGATDAGGKRVLYTTSNLNQLVAPAFAWYWKFSQDNTYLTRGDAMFSAGVLGAGTNSKASITDQDYSWSGKEFSLNYKWSFDYVRWRSGDNGSAVGASH